MDPKLQAWRYPVQQELEGLLSELAVFNERIAELVRQGHRSHALNVLTAQALSLAGQIDELRCLLFVPKPSHRRETPSRAFGGPRAGTFDCWPAPPVHFSLFDAILNKDFNFELNTPLFPIGYAEF